MANYIGVACPVCHKRFVAGDDIVVCPECGTPHHRACWQQNGDCFNKMRHKDGYVFEVPRVNPRDNQPQVACPYCGQSNPAGATFCIHCGKVLRDAASEERQAPTGTYSTGDPFGARQNIQSFNLYGGVDPDSEIDGVKVRDIATYIGKSSGYYLFQYKNMQRRGKKTSFSLPGFFIAPIFLLYRKMWGMGLLALLVQTVLTLPQMVLDFLSLFNVAWYESVVNWAGTNTLYGLLMACSLLSLVWKIVISLYANHLYLRHVVKKVKHIQSHATSDQQYQAAIAKKGGVSTVVMVITASYFIAAFVITFMGALMGS